MTTTTLEKQTTKLKHEVELLRSFVVGQAGKDPEGNYKPAFVKRALKATSQAPEYEFKDIDTFLKQLKS